MKADTGALVDDDSNSSADELSQGRTPSTQDDERTPAERHAFLFQQNVRTGDADLRELHPLPSQIPYLLDVFSENVNSVVSILHMPTITKMARKFRESGMKDCTPADEALLFSVYYAAIISMEDSDVSF